MYLHKEHTAN